jgi:endonuclease G
MNRLPFVILLLTCAHAKADILSVHCPLGCPSSPIANDLLFTHLYAASNNPETKFFDWVAYEVNVTNFGTSPGRNWASDPLLADNETLEADDYKGASKAIAVDRGHQAPLASFAGSRYWSEVNYLSNITPQSKTLNQGSWKNLEDAVRGASEYRNSVYVVTGPLFEKEMQTLPKADEAHKIPSGYFKVAYRLNGDAVAFILDQDTPRKADYCTKVVELKEVSIRAGLALTGLREAKAMGEDLGCK